MQKRDLSLWCISLFDVVMPNSERNWGASLAMAVFVALFATLIFASVALVPRVGYTSETHLYERTSYSQYGFAVVDFGCNASFNPFLYPVTWLFGKGYMSGNFSMVYLPQSYGGEGGRVTWGKPELIKGEAEMKVVLDQFYMNLPILPALFFAIELAGWRRLYIWFLGGVVGFALSFPLGVFAGLFMAVFLTYFILPKLRKARA